MKRTITVLMTLALIGSMAFVGFAGTAAAGANHHDDDSGDDLNAAASVSQTQSVSQTNVIDQDASQFADQDATGVDIDFEDAMDGGDGDDSPDDGMQGSIQTITFTQAQGPNPVAVFEWDGSEFVLVDSLESVKEGDITVTATAFNEDGDPIAASYSLNDGLPPGQAPNTATVASNGQTCSFTVASVGSPPSFPVEGTVTACEPDNGGNGGNGDNGDGTDGIEGSTGNQTVNQIIDQDADASNSNAQNADASASAGDILSVLLG